MNKKDTEISGSSRTRVKMNTKTGSGASGARAIKGRDQTSARAGSKVSTRANTRANTHTSRKVQKSGGGMLAYVLVSLLTFGAIISDITGPFQGWLRPAKQLEEPKEEVAKPVLVEKPVEKVVVKSVKKEAPKVKEEVFQAKLRADLTAEEVEEADEEKLKKERYEEVYAELKAKTKKPVLNKRVMIKMKDGRKIFCHVIAIGKRSLDLVKIEPYNGKMSLDATKLSNESRTQYFGELVARNAAKKIVDREEHQGFFKKDPATESGFFDPSIEPTPERLVHAVKEVKEWLDFQARRGSGSAVTRLGAKKNGQASILYIYLGRAFFTKNKNQKTQWLEAVRQFWTLRCKSNSIVREENAHVCLVLDGRNVIVGGTKEDDSKKIWLKKTRR